MTRNSFNGSLTSRWLRLTSGKAMSSTPRVPPVARPKTPPKPALVPLVPGTRLLRAYAQPPGAADRALSFNPNSDGRASPVLRPTGKADPALYAAVDSPAGAIVEMLFHTVLKHYRSGGSVASSVFDHIHLVELTTTVQIQLVSIDSMDKAGVIAPGFDSPRYDSYADTQSDAQLLYEKYQDASGLVWTSARSLAYSAVLYESRTPEGALEVSQSPWRLRDDSDHYDYVLEVMEYHGIRMA